MFLVSIPSCAMYGATHVFCDSYSSSLVYLRCGCQSHLDTVPSSAGSFFCSESVPGLSPAVAWRENSVHWKALDRIPCPHFECCGSLSKLGFECVLRVLTGHDPGRIRSILAAQLWLGVLVQEIPNSPIFPFCSCLSVVLYPDFLLLWLLVSQTPLVNYHWKLGCWYLFSLFIICHGLSCCFIEFICWPCSFGGRLRGFSTYNMSC